MIRILVSNSYNEEKKYIEGACLAADTKPVDGIITGSLMLEVDTGNVYAFDEVGGEWDQIAALGGGS